MLAADKSDRPKAGQLSSDLHVYRRPLPLRTLLFRSDTHQWLELRDMGPPGTMERGLTGYAPTYGDRGARPWSGTKGTVRQMTGSGLLKRVERVAGGACSAPTLPSLALSRPQATTLPALQSPRLCLGTLCPFQAGSSSLVSLRHPHPRQVPSPPQAVGY